MLPIIENNFANDYDLIDKIGKGAFSDVWSCVQQTSKKIFAAKILNKIYDVKTMDLATWNSINEVYITNSVENHPFLLIMKAAYHEPETGKVIFVSELMNRSLFDIVENKCVLTNYQIKTYMYQILEGLNYLHENGFIHRDIKPENILLTLNDRLLKIGDFGFTCKVAVGQPYTEYVGTRWYRSPECILTQGRYCTKMDIWASGCVLYEIATGRPMFDGMDEIDQILKIDQVLGCPEQRLIDKFKKHKSDVFTKRYEMSELNENIAKGTGLPSVYQPYKPSYDLLKDMIVYDSVERFSADQLLRKSYFYEMRNSEQKNKLRVFKEMLSKKKLSKSSSSEKKRQFSTNKKQGPDGDVVLNLNKDMEQDENITPSNDEKSDNSCLDSQEQNLPNVCSKRSTDQKMANIDPENKKQNLISKINKKNSLLEKKTVDSINIVVTQSLKKKLKIAS